LDGVYFVALASLDSADDLAESILEAFGVSSVLSESQEEQLIEYLSRAETLLVLDNFEHLLPGAHLLGRLLEAAPYLRILVTSRQRLALRWERQISLGGLESPLAEYVSDFEDAPAVRLYIQSAQCATAHFSYHRKPVVSIGISGSISRAHAT
jgi:predicted ATPase